MYIDRWWDKMSCSDEAEALADYFFYKRRKELNFGEILKDLHLDTVLGKKPLYEAGNDGCFECVYYIHEDSEGVWRIRDNEGEDTFTQDDMHSISDVILYLSVLLLQSLVDGSVIIKCNHKPPFTVEFVISATKEEIGLLVAELEKILQSPQLYYSGYVLKNFTTIMEEDIKNICSDLKIYYRR